MEGTKHLDQESKAGAVTVLTLKCGKLGWQYLESESSGQLCEVPGARREKEQQSLPDGTWHQMSQGAVGGVVLFLEYWP